MSKTIFITGASSGFGLLTAQSLLDKGYTVFATMRQVEGKNAPKAQQLKDHAANGSGKLHTLELDVTSEQSVEAAIQQALALENTIDVLLNNAGLGVGGYSEGFTTEQFQKLFDVNVFGVQRLMRAILPSMRAQGEGLIINVSSVMGRFVIPFSGAYTSSKFALEGLSETYHYELAGTGVDVTIVEPGGFVTSFADSMIPPADPERIQTYGERANMADQMWEGFLSGMEANKEQYNPQMVADAIVNLIETPAGQRPMRTVVEVTGGEGPKMINDVQGQVQAGFFDAVGLSDLPKLKTKS